MAKAQVGDLIRIVKATFSKGKYKNGDILEVVRRVGSDDCGVFVADGDSTFIYDSEYEIHRKAGEEDALAYYQSEVVGSEVDRIVATDAVNPQHYKQGRTEVIDIIEDAVAGAEPFEAVCQANVLKYALRYRHKNGVEDLKKAVWYAEKLIEHLTRK